MLTVYLFHIRTNFEYKLIDILGFSMWVTTMWHNEEKSLEAYVFLLYYILCGLQHLSLFIIMGYNVKINDKY